MEKYPWWTDEQKKLADEVREAVEELIPLAAEYSWKKEYPWEVIKDIAKRGYFGALIPQKYGGQDEAWGVTGACILVEELSRLGTACHVFSSTLFGGTQEIAHWGTEEQKQRLLPKIASGESIGAICITEPYAGSDAAGIETSAQREGDVYLVNGKKRFITNAAAASVYMTYVKTSDRPEDREKYRHLTALVIEKGTPGFSIEKINELTGFDGMYNGYLNFDNARVPVANRLAEEGEGWKVLVSGLNLERTIAGCTWLGPMREALRYAIFHMQRRVQFGQPTINIATNQFKVSDMVWKLKIARLFTYYTAYLLDLGKDVPLEPAICKLFNSEMAMSYFIDASQCMGGDGCTRFYPVEGFLRDAKIGEIVAGTNEIMRLLIFRESLKAMSGDLKPQRRVMHKELKVAVPVGKAKATPVAANEQSILETLAENYRVNPGIYMTIDELMEQIDATSDQLNSLLTTLDGKGLAKLSKDRRGAIALARATYNGLKQARPKEYYKWIPSWVRDEDLF